MKKQQQTTSHPEARGILMLSGCLILFLALISFNLNSPQSNWLGLVGHWAAWICNYLFGLSSFFILAFIGWMGWKLLLEGTAPESGSKTFYFSLFIFSFSILLNLFAEQGFAIPLSLKHKIITESLIFDLPYPHRHTRLNLGGAPLYFIYKDLPLFNLRNILSDLGIGITFTLTTIISLLFLTKVQVVPLLKECFQRILEKKESFKTPPKEKQEPLDLFSKTPFKKKEAPIVTPPLYTQAEKPQMKIHTLVDKIEEKLDEPLSKRQSALNAQRVHNGDFGLYHLPPASLLTNPKKIDHPQLKKELKRHAEILEETLLSFGIEAKVGDINCGPTIISFEIHPAVGVKVQKITALENDIALKLQAKSIRIIAPIPGKAAVGVEIPSPYPQEVSFKEMLIHYQQNPKKLNIPVLMGKTVSGENLLSDLAKMPHCLIAGATGSGKSVCVNSLVMSILMNARPDEVKLVMVDPKKVELTPYTKLPHMIAPVITEAHGAYAALSWLVKEMQIRYDILKQLGLRNITAFNERKINAELESSLSITVPVKMYFIVAIIDEFADLMMASSSDLETPIARIAQMARAVGIHLILATQRPSREVITGLIKANFPTRIAFKVASRVNSQIILDENGGESLLGNGDMLFLPPASSILVRAQGVYISDEDINRVISYICDQAPPSYLIPSFDTMGRESLLDETEESSSKDALYDQAKAIVVETRTASTTFLQRKLKIGYARAASLMDELELRGVIGPQEGSKARRVFVEGDDDDQES